MPKEADKRGMGEVLQRLMGSRDLFEPQIPVGSDGEDGHDGEEEVVDEMEKLKV